MSADCGCSVALTVLLAACNDDMAGNGQGKPLPEREYPVTLMATVKTVTRATADNTWTGGEQVAVQATSSEHDFEWREREVKTYKVADNGRLISDEPIWWTNSAEKKCLKAWYCGDGSTAAGKENALKEPKFWNVQKDQSGADGTTDGYHASDLLFASAEYASFDNGAVVPLKFYHQTAKVVVNIRKAEYATSAELIRSVKIGDSNLVVSTLFTAPGTYPNEGKTVGTWKIVEVGDATITPRKLDAPTKPEYVVSYEALVIPQPTAGRRLVTVETDAGTMSYTAPADASPFASGKVHTYNITVRSGDPLQLEVEVLSGGEWTDNGSEEVTSRRLTVYKADDIKLGDYFYNDGTTSDGGLRALYTDGSYKMEAQKPAPVVGKTIVGIVFQTASARIGDAEQRQLGNTCHGLVMAVKNAATKVCWGPKGVEEAELAKCTKKAQLYSDISGYGNYTYICTTHADNMDSYPAFKAVVDYNTACPVSRTTTGWFLPSSGQWWDILQNLGGCPALADSKEQASAEEKGEFNFTQQGKVLDNLNKWMELVSDDSKDTFAGTQKFGTSSIRHKDNAWFWEMGVTAVYLKGYGKSNEYTVRPILAF